MKFENGRGLEEFRLNLNKIQPSSDFGTVVNLYGVYHHLNSGVIKFTKITKKYLYDENDNKHQYMSYNIPMTVFTSANEAWYCFSQKLKQREEALELHIKIENEDIAKAKKIINQQIAKTPEYFI